MTETELKNLKEELEDLAAGLMRRSRETYELRDNQSPMTDARYDQLSCKATAYNHAAELLCDVLKRRLWALQPTKRFNEDGK